MAGAGWVCLAKYATNLITGELINKILPGRPHQLHDLVELVYV